MKTFIKILEQQIRGQDQTFLKISNNLKDEKDAYKTSTNELEKKYFKVLVDIKLNIDKRKKVNSKDSTMNIKDFDLIIANSKAFKEYNKDKMTNISDFKHLMN